MNLLYFNLALDSNDTALGFTIDWVNTISKDYNKVFLITLKKKTYNVNSNVQVFSLYTDREIKFIAFVRFYYFLIKILIFNKIHRCFSHMNPLFILLTLGILRFKKIKTLLWYTHPNKTLKLKIACFFSDAIITASEYSFPIKSNKVHVIGHGVNSNLFNNKIKPNDLKYITYVGRISKIKNIHILIESFSSLNNPNYILMIVGDTITKEDINYKKELIKIVEKNKIQNKVIFKGPLNVEELKKIYSKTFIHINLTKRGSLDKVVIEAAMMGVISLVCNEGFRSIYGNLYDEFSFDSTSSLLDKIRNTISLDDSYLKKIRNIIMNNAINEHSLDSMSARISNVYRFL